MDKKSTAWISTNRGHVRDSGIAVIRSQVEQRTQEVAAASPTTDTTSGGTSTSSPASSSVSNTQAEAPTYYTTDGIVLYDNEGNRWGEIVNQIPVGDSSAKTDIQINAILNRLDASNFELPSRAQYVMDVWFDNIKAEPTNHYNFFLYSLISTIAPQASDVVVSAFYLNQNEVI